MHLKTSGFQEGRGTWLTASTPTKEVNVLPASIHSFTYIPIKAALHPLEIQRRAGVDPLCPKITRARKSVQALPRPLVVNREHKQARGAWPSAGWDRLREMRWGSSDFVHRNRLGGCYGHCLWPVSSSRSDDDLQVNAVMISGPRDAVVEAGDQHIPPLDQATLIFLIVKITLKKMFTRRVRNHRPLLL